jgi:hypothetical protein
MKTTKLECVTREDYLADVARRIEAAHTVSKSGGRRGGGRVIARHYGMLPQALANTLNGYVRPSRKMLEKDGLEAVMVFVRKGKE